MTESHDDRTSELSRRALELPVEQRDGFVRSECGADDALLRSVLDTLAAAVDAALPERDSDTPSSSSASSTLLARLSAHAPRKTRYAMKGEIARGGMGAILKVWDEDLRRTLAMKVALGSEEAGREDTPSVNEHTLGRFLDEAQVTGQLDHPGIVPVHELGVDSEGQVYFTMRLVKGQTLAEIFVCARDGRDEWTRTRVLGVVLKVCEAMSYAHAKGVIHRDLKPANIMVGRFGEVYVMDWGVAKVVGKNDARDLRIRPLATTAPLDTERQAERDSDPGTPLFTMDGMVVGTPAYMSPEQARGDLDALDERSDVYAIGAMLYELLTGQMPYVPSGVRPGAYTIWRWVLSGPPDPVSKLATDVPAELEAICEKAMSREPEARYRDVLELADDLRAYVEGRVVQAHKTGAWVEARKWIERNRPLAIALAAALVLLVVGLASSLILTDHAVKRADEVLRLSALQDHDDLVASLDELWPAHPAHIPKYEEWIREARALVDQLPDHRAKLDELVLVTQAPDGGTRQERWWRNQLTKLVSALETLGEPGLLGDGISSDVGWHVPRRLRMAEHLRDGFATGGEYSTRWNEAASAIREHPDYGGLTLAPQMGLVPIGQDPHSGLWEFWHVQSGDEPIRDDAGVLRMTDGTGLVFVLLPRGKFEMGAQKQDPAGANYDSLARGDAPVHTVTLSPFFLSRYELTQGQWSRFRGENPAEHGPRADFAQQHQDLRHPQVRVSWTTYAEQLPRMGLTFPSEAQWEYAARAGTDTPWWTGSDEAALLDRRAANLSLPDGHDGHAPVGTFAANAFGLHDVLGNVAELCLDAYMPNSYGTAPRQNPVDAPGDVGAAGERVLRGGSYTTPARMARSANRGGIASTFVGAIVGVRPAREIDR